MSAKNIGNNRELADNHPERSGHSRKQMTNDFGSWCVSSGICLFVSGMRDLQNLLK